MRNKLIFGISGIIILVLTFCLTIKDLSFSVEELSSDGYQHKGSAYKAWEISELSDTLATKKLNQIDFMNENSMKGTYIELEKGDSFKRKAKSDNIYYLYSGVCTAKVKNIEQRFNKGDVIFVKKGSELYINKSDEPLKIVLVSMVLASDSKTPNWKYFSESNIEASRISEANTWNPFIRYSNVIFGMYMLPQTIDGDSRLVHPWQELNIITSGNSKFVMDTDTIDVEEGSIIFVDEGNGHYFDGLKVDIDILILWEQRSKTLK